jgi:acetyl esterase/lipase
MPPCQQPNSDKNRNNGSTANAKGAPIENAINKQEETVIVQAPGTPDYVRCDSKGPFASPFAGDPKKTAAEINATELNLNLGQSLLLREKSQTLIKVIRFLDTVFFAWWENLLFGAWNRLPTALRRRIFYGLWTLYAPLHRAVLGRSTGLHATQSLQYHALTTAMWIGRFLPVSVNRMRFMLHQLTAWHPTPLQAGLVEPIHQAPVAFSSATDIPDAQKDHCHVSGVYLHYQKSSVPTEHTLLWYFGGAFLAGDAVGNTGPADSVGTRCKMDVFVPSYRVAPEDDINDIIWDVALAYRYVYELRQRRQQDPTKIILFGCSSGAALGLRVLQSIAEANRNQETLPSYIGPMVRGLQMPRAMVLASPYCDYKLDKDPNGSFFQYNKHDLIVNEAVQEAGLKYLGTHSTFSYFYGRAETLCFINLRLSANGIGEHSQFFAIVIVLLLLNLSVWQTR